MEPSWLEMTCAVHNDATAWLKLKEIFKKTKKACLSCERFQSLSTERERETEEGGGGEGGGRERIAVHAYVPTYFFSRTGEKTHLCV